MSKSERDAELTLDFLIENLKADRRAHLTLNIPNTNGLLDKIYARLQQRHKAYATDDLIADEVLHLIDEEIEHEKENGMIIVDLHQNGAGHYSRHQPMAAAIAEILKTKGECFPADLEAKGFAKNDIKQQWSIAYALAMIERRMADESPQDFCFSAA